MFDADVVGGLSSTRLDHWVEQENMADIVFYERAVQTGEIMAGNYFVRNTPFARAFLRYWTAYDSKQPSGFSSADNGAIHQVLVEAIGFDDAPRCLEAYNNLTSGPSFDIMFQRYWVFVACTKYLLGPPRRWSVEHEELGKGVISILPMHHSWDEEEPYVQPNFVNAARPFCHGLKISNASGVLVNEAFLTIDEHGCFVSAIHAKQGVMTRLTREQLGEIITSDFQYKANDRGPNYTSKLPFFPPGECSRDLSCVPLATEAQWKRAYKLMIEWKDSPYAKDPLSTARSSQKAKSFEHPKRPSSLKTGVLR